MAPQIKFTADLRTKIPVTATQPRVGLVSQQVIELRDTVQGSSYLLGQRFRACFVLKFALQRGEGEKRDGVQISKQSTQNL